MIDLMERIRVYFDADEELRYAIKQAALRAGVSGSEFIESILKEHIGEKALSEAAKVVREQQAAKPKRRSD